MKYLMLLSFINMCSQRAWEFRMPPATVILTVCSLLIIPWIIVKNNEAYEQYLYISSLIGIIAVLYFFKERNETDDQGYARVRRRARRADYDVKKPPKVDNTDRQDDEVSEGSTESSLQEFPIVPEASRRGNRRQRKKRNSLKFNKSKLKAMDDSSETSSTNNDRSPKLEVHKEKTKVYEPLQIFTNLALKEDEIYRELELHVLTLEQLKLYGFPIESPDRSGHIILSNNLVSGATERHCCRCNSLFEIDSDGQYQATSLCQYHPKKQTPFRHGVQYLGEYPCCNGNFLSKGCITCPFHVSVESCLHDNEFAKARQKRHLNEVTSRTVYAVDCEMLFTTAGMEVAKVGIVGVDGLTVYESHVLPQNEILDYNTLYSGITEKDLNGVTTTLKDVQTYLQKLLNKNSILIGHALDNDLKALRFVHEKIVDTSVVFPHPYNKKYKKSLKALAKEFLNKHIQQSEDGHDPIEDARTCMDLMLNKIRIDSQNCLPLSQDENHNAILQNIEQTELHSNTFARQSWIYQPNNYNVPCFDTFRGNHYTHVLTQNYSYPQQQKQCVY